jgi:hypothetical protein
MNIDPLTEDYMDWGPYVFSGNRVIDSRELEGLEPTDANDAFVETIAGGINSLRASVSNVAARVVSLFSSDDVNARYVTGEGGQLVMVPDMPEETPQEQVVNTGFDLLNIGATFLGGPEGTLMATEGKVVARKALNDIKDSVKNVKDGTKTATKSVNPKKVAREAGAEKRAKQPASENYAKDKAKKLEKTKGKAARREAHDKKEKGAGDRTKKQLDEDYQ